MKNFEALTPTYTSRSSTAQTAETPPLRNRKNDKKNGMNSTLFVTMTLLCYHPHARGIT
jgi:hypothetical protein